ncbi:MAG TPA: ATP-binding protein [Candidatus Paceibacterota bacterium]|nr:ATP-binding protein [Verrucomicrobiota bacterium]HRZ46935.1 ATP-binding protein [Candidatus Paceibacterota bacterium]HRZ92102.1 ATP-binding protein [Candidatus Paceibacterota bacterium]
MRTQRHASIEASQERYLSAPEYRISRPISATAAVAKAELLGTIKQRDLILFLQGLSLRPGGVKRLAAEIKPCLRPRRTPIMHQRIDLGFGSYDLSGLDPRCPQALDQFLVDLCINPKMLFGTSTDEDLANHVMREQFIVQSDGTREGDFFPAVLETAEDVIGDLYRFQADYVSKATQSLTMTSIGRQVCDALDCYLFKQCDKRMLVVQGNAQIGKTTAAHAWCQQHIGQARYVTLSGILSRTVFFRSLSDAFGVAGGMAYNSTQMQDLLERLLPRMGLMLVIDEAHYLWPQSERVNGPPLLINWLDTALVNQGVRVALVTTPQFAHRRRMVESQTGWTSEQLAGRIKRYLPLPLVPTKLDLEKVARRLLPDADPDAIKHMVAYAIVTKRYMPSVVDTADDARMIAGQEGRSRILFKDVERAIKYYREPSDQAQARAFDRDLDQARTRPGKRSASVLQPAGNGVAFTTSRRASGLPVEPARPSDEFAGSAQPTGRLERASKDQLGVSIGGPEFTPEPVENGLRRIGQRPPSRQTVEAGVGGC